MKFCASRNLNSLTRIPWSSHGVERNKQGCCDISVGKFVQRCEIAPRRFQVKSIIDKVSAVATQVDYMATRRQWGHTHIKVLTHGKLTQGGKINRKLEIQQGHKHRSIKTSFSGIHGDRVFLVLVAHSRICLMTRSGFLGGKKCQINIKAGERKYNSTKLSVLSCMTRRSSKEPDPNTQI